MLFPTKFPVPALGVLAALLLASLAGAAVADTGSLAVSAVVPSRNNCKFSTGTLILDFGLINPASTANATATALSTFRCNGSAPLATFGLTVGDGLHSSGPGARRMRHATTLTEYLPYALSVTPTSGSVAKGVDQNVTITGTIQPFEFQNARAGAYQDTVVLTVVP